MKPFDYEKYLKSNPLLKEEQDAISEDLQTKIFSGNQIRRSYRPAGSTREIKVGDQFTESVMGMTMTSHWAEKAGSTYEVIEDLGNDTYKCKIVKHNDY